MGEANSRLPPLAAMRSAPLARASTAAILETVSARASTLVNLVPPRPPAKTGTSTMAILDLRETFVDNETVSYFFFGECSFLLFSFLG